MTMKMVHFWHPLKRGKTKKNVKILLRHHIKYCFCEESNFLSNLKKRACLSFPLLNIFEFDFCPGNYAPPEKKITATHVN